MTVSNQRTDQEPRNLETGEDPKRLKKDVKEQRSKMNCTSTVIPPMILVKIRLILTS